MSKQFVGSIRIPDGFTPAMITDEFIVSSLRKDEWYLPIGDAVFAAHSAYWNLFEQSSDIVVDRIRALLYFILHSFKENKMEICNCIIGFQMETEMLDARVNAAVWQDKELQG